MYPQQYQAKRPVTALAGPYGHPLHPIMVTVPIGAWTTSFVFDIASHLVHPAGFLVQGALWLIVVGLGGAVVAGSFGLMDLLAIAEGTKAHRTARIHMSLNLLVTAAYAIGFAWRYHGYHHPAPVPARQFALSAVSLAVLAVSGYLGGKLTYKYGVRVAEESTQAEGYSDHAAPTRPSHATRA
jgi:uncharacterized membrane protein